MCPWVHGSAPLLDLDPTRWARALSEQEDLNFLLTNRVPRNLLTRFMGWYSRIESPTLTRASIAVWKLFADDLDFSESKRREFTSLQECFTRELREGSRPIDARPEVVVSPCDAIVGACGKVEGTRVFQAKGYPYELNELVPDDRLQERYRDGTFVTLRLTSSMYHRFHAPVDCRVREITYISGDTWNVNPIALRRVEKLFCKNERAVVDLELTSGRGGHLTLVPIAAILVASMKFHCLPGSLHLGYRGPNRIACDAHYTRGEELGYFEHGSTIVVFATSSHRLAAGVGEGTKMRMGQALLVDANHASG